MDDKAVAVLVRNFVVGRPQVRKVKKSDLPTAVAAAMDGWANSNNLPMDDSGTGADYYVISGTGQGISDAFVIDVSGDDPDQFRATGILQDGSVIGEAIFVGS